MRFYWALCALLATVALSCTREEPLPDLPDDPEPEADSTSIRASLPTFDNTKADFQMNDEGTCAKMFWSSGDTLVLFGLLKDNTRGYYGSLYSTEDSGSSSATFTSTGPMTETVDYYWGIYPNIDYVDIYTLTDNGERIMCVAVSLPASQQATPGKPDPATYRMYAFSEDITEELSFKSLTSLIKFRLPADAASGLSSVKLMANDFIAGDVLLYDLDKDDPESSLFGGEPIFEPFSKTVTLNGPFQGDTDYYFSVYPKTLANLYVIFTDKEGQTSAILLGQDVTLSRSHILDLGTLNVPPPGKDPDVITWQTGHPGKAPTLCVLGDGFTDSEQDLFVSRANSGMEFLFETEPFKAWKEYFNVYLIKAASNESGASVTDGYGNITQKKDTRFGVAYADYGLTQTSDMWCDAQSVWDYVLGKCPAVHSGSTSFSDLIVILLINDSRYGGMSHTFSDGRSIAMVPYIDNGQPIRWDFPYQEAAGITATEPDTHIVTEEEREEMGITFGDWRNVILHEGAGHGFGRFVDEYWYEPITHTGGFPAHEWPVPDGLNLTDDISSSSTSFFWKDLINYAPLLEKDSRYGRVGTFQGGHFSMFGCWRSEKVSCMIENRPYFSLWQRILIVKRIKELAGEVFDFNEFLDKDVTIDPVRDIPTKVPAADLKNLPTRPLLPPPVLIEVESYSNLIIPLSYEPVPSIGQRALFVQGFQGDAPHGPTN